MTMRSTVKRWDIYGLASAKSRWFSGSTPPDSKKSDGGQYRRNLKQRVLLYSSPARDANYNDATPAWLGRRCNLRIKRSNGCLLQPNVCMLLTKLAKQAASLSK